MKYILTIFGILLLLFIVWAMVFGGLTNNNQSNTGTTTPDMNEPADPDDGPTPPSGYRSVTSESVGVSLLIPADATTNNPNNSVFTVRYLGPDNQAGTEIQDGFFFSVESDTAVAADTSLAEYAQAQVNAVEARGLTATEGLTRTTVNGEPAYRFSHETELGGVTTALVMLPAADQGYLVNYTISGTDTTAYEDMVAAMLNSIVFMPENDTPAPTRSSVSIALLDFQDTGPESSGPVRGCDRVVFTEESIDPTTMPLTAAMETLFDWSDTTIAGWHNFIAQTNDTLDFDRAEVQNGTAHIYLTGELSSLAGVCDNPRARIQIEETALQFSTVDNVQLYLNGEATNLQPSGEGT